MSEQRDFVDYRQGGDSGQNSVDAIQPIVDGETVNQTLLRRPSENLRGRFEVARADLEDLLYYRDSNHLVIEGATGNWIKWGGTVASGGDGKLTQSGALTIRPLLTPATSTKGTLSVGTALLNEVTYTIASSAYATEQMNAVTVEHQDTLAAALAVTITTGPVKHILVVFDSLNAAHDVAAVKVAVDIAVGADADLNTKLVVTTSAVAGNPILVLAETRIEGTADQVAHLIPSGVLTQLTDTAGTGTALADGDAVGIWYRYRLDPVGTGGRQESNPDRGTATIPLSSLFITSGDATKIPGAVPLCKVVNNELVWFDGSRYAKGAVGPIGTTGNLWVDATNFAGANTLTNAGGIDNPLSSPTAQVAFDAVDNRLAQLRAYTYVCTDGVASFGGDFQGATALQQAVTACAGTGGTVFLRRGTYTIPNLYTFGVNIRIVGEEKNTVLLQPAAASTNFIFSEGMSIENLTIGANTSTVTYASLTKKLNMRDVDFAGLTAHLNATFCTLNNVNWLSSNVTPGGTSLTITTESTVENCSVGGRVHVTGSFNTLRTVKITASTSDNAVLCDTGTVSNSFYGVHVVGTAMIPLAVPIAAVVVLRGANHTWSGGEINTVGSTLDVALDYSLAVEGTNIQVQGVRVIAGNHPALHVLDDTLVSTTATFRGIACTNVSTTAPLLATAITLEARVTLEDCALGTAGEASRPLLSLTDSNAVFQFKRCIFAGETTNGNYVTKTVQSDFDNCTFLFTGTTIPDSVAGLTNGIWIFEGTAGKREPVIRDCTFDMADVPQINAGANEFKGAYVSVLSATLENPSFTNLNWSGIRNLGTGTTPGGSVLRLLADSTLRGGSFTWTNTPVTGGGTDGGWVRVAGPRVTIENFTSINASSAIMSVVEILAVDIVDVPDLTIRNCHLEDGTKLRRGIGVLSPTSVTANARFTLINCTFGSTTNYLSSAPYFFWGSESSIVGNRWYTDVSGYTSVLTGKDHTRLMFAHNTLTVVNPAVPTTPVFTFDNSILNGSIFEGNTYTFTSTAVGDRKLYGGSAGGTGNLVSHHSSFIDLNALTSVSFGLLFSVDAGL